MLTVPEMGLSFRLEAEFVSGGLGVGAGGVTGVMGCFGGGGVGI